MRAYLIRHFDGARCPAAVVYDLSATAAHQQYAVLPGATFATTTVERAPAWDGHAPDGPTLAEVLAEYAEAAGALDGEGGDGLLAERVRRVVAEARRLRDLRPTRVYSDAEITAALKASGGNVLRAANALGCSCTVIVQRLSKNPEVRPPGLPKFGPGRPRGHRVNAEATDRAREARAEEARQAVETHGDMTRAGRALGVSRQTIANRLAWVRREAA